jgi:uncharacterized protein YggL (DUF469 family)
MSKNRSYRLRKKLHLDEFVEHGFDISFVCTDAHEMDFLAELTSEVFHPRKMSIVYEDKGQIFVSRREGPVDEQDIDAVNAWFERHDGISSFEVGRLVDAWHPPRGHQCFDRPDSRRKIICTIRPNDG